MADNNVLGDMLSRLRGFDPEAEKDQKKKAEEHQAEYESQYGKVDEEPGIEEDYTLEELGSNLSPAGIARMGARSATRGAIRKMRDHVPEKAAPEINYARDVNPSRPPAKEGPVWTEGREPAPFRETEATTGFTNDKFRYEYPEDKIISKPKFRELKRPK